MFVSPPGRRGCSTHKPGGRSHTLLIPLLAVTGCGTWNLKEMPLSEMDSSALRYRSASPPAFTPTEEPATAEGGDAAARAGLAASTVKQKLVRGDALVQVLQRAGLPLAHERLPDTAPLSPEDASALFGALLEQPVTVAGFGPRLVASRLLREVVEGDEEVSRAELLERVKRYERLAVLRPDGTLAMALTGAARQRVGEVQWREGSFRAGGFVVGALYSGATGVWRPVDAALQRGWDSPVLAEVRDDAVAQDGAEETFIELVLALGQLLTQPGDSLSALAQLPEGLAMLVTSSPAYLERFRKLTRGEQVRELSKLSAALLSTWGTVVGTPRTLAALGRGWEAHRVPVVSLAEDGTLVVERVAVPVGRAVTVLGEGPGAAAVLHLEASLSEPRRRPEPVGGPGRWGPSRELLSPRAARYQEHVSGHSASEAYWLGEPGRKDATRFDGVAEGALLEARGPGFASRFNDDFTPKPWFARWGAKALVEGARRQQQAALATGARVRWHVSEEKAARALRKLFDGAQLDEVEVLHTPAP
ncbi:Tox-REase-5 domain-containing protein [Pyxidicoccus sp. MSG2]|uniref:Tox-REase-5 domain-containing protein n=1 Tax=Pyxidicoccus sp. MSG2 TaxID=2996790 RepID=UPI0022708999|nr:Tox-REase-5 domain-containing protein [Pyxidicoccus sp. MSG2]MCY1019739.1 Tox-REase-5 domain-containing protein [Pyxidicoccus sp. MSG2]